MSVSSSYFTTGNYQGRYLQFEWNVNRQDIQGNYTVIDWKWLGKGSASSSWYYLNNSYLNVYGARRYTQGSRVQLYDGTVLATGQTTIYHNDQGYATFSADGGGGIYKTSVNCTGGGTWDLPRINRYPILNWASDFNDESNPTINITTYNTYPIRVKIEAGGNTQLITRDINADYNGNYTFSLSEDERNKLRSMCSGNSIGVRETVCAMENGNEKYVTYRDQTMYIVNANPTFSTFTFKDTNTKTTALTGNNSYVVSGYSNIQATVPTANKAVAKKYASMNKYRLTIGDKSTEANYSSSADVNMSINNIDRGTFNMYAIDSRGNSTLVTKVAGKIISYSPITINASQITAQRNNNGSGTDCNLKFSGTFWNGSFGKVTNSIKSVTYQLKRTQDTTWITGTTPVTLKITNNAFSFEGLIRSNNSNYSWNLGDNYNIKVIVTDELSTKEVETILISAKPNIAIAKKGVAINQLYDDNLGGDLQLCGGNVYGAKVLYDNASGSNGTITLSDNAGNYNFIQVFWFDQYEHNPCNSGIYANPNNKHISLVGWIPQPGKSNVLHFSLETIRISNNTLTFVDYLSGYTQESSFSYWGTSDSKIYKVLGYKRL